MGSEALRARENWQTQSGEQATLAEQNLCHTLAQAFEGTEYILHRKPAHLKNLYGKVDLPPDVLQQIFCPEGILRKSVGVWRLTSRLKTAAPTRYCSAR